MSKTCQLKILKTWRLLIFLLKKPGDFILNREILKSPKKNWSLCFFSTIWVIILVNRSSLAYFWIIWCLMPAYSFCSTQQKYDIWWWFVNYEDFAILYRLMLSIYKHACSTVKNCFKEQILWRKVYVYEKHLLKGDLKRWLTEKWLNFLRMLVTKRR